MTASKVVLGTASFLALLIADAAPIPAEPAGETSWARVTEDDAAIKIETDAIETVLPKKNPKCWMTGIEKGSFLDKATGFREAGDGLCWWTGSWSRAATSRGAISLNRPTATCSTTSTTASAAKHMVEGPAAKQ